MQRHQKERQKKRNTSEWWERLQCGSLVWCQSASIAATSGAIPRRAISCCLPWSVASNCCYPLWLDRFAPTRVPPQQERSRRPCECPRWWRQKKAFSTEPRNWKGCASWWKIPYLRLAPHPSATFQLTTGAKAPRLNSARWHTSFLDSWSTKLLSCCSACVTLAYEERLPCRLPSTTSEHLPSTPWHTRSRTLGNIPGRLLQSNPREWRRTQTHDLTWAWREHEEHPPIHAPCLAFLRSCTELECFARSRGTPSTIRHNHPAVSQENIWYWWCSRGVRSRLRAPTHGVAFVEWQ